MNHLERWENTIKRKPFDRLPRFYSATHEFSESLMEYLGSDLDTIIYDKFDIDYRFQNDGYEAKSWDPAYVGPELKTFDDGSFENFLGSRERKVYHQDGKGYYTETVEYVLGNATTVEEVDAHRWPQADWFDYSSILPAIEKYPDYPFMVGYISIGWFSWMLRGMQKSFEDLYLAPEIAEAINQHLCDFGFEYYSNMLETLKDYVGKNLVCIHLADDWGVQDGLIMRPEFFDQYYAKHYKRLIDLAHSYGLKVEFHSCGAARELYPKFIEVGVDIMNPVQTSAKGMVPSEIKKEYGKDLSFSGAIDVQQVLPNATVPEVKDEVKSVLDAMGDNGGFFPGPAHNIQLGTPPENVVAMYDAMDECFGV